MKSIISQLKTDKIKINFNKNPVEMAKFLSFLTVEVTRNLNCLGGSNGWCEFVNEERKLIITGGFVGGVNYLNSIQYGTKLDNPYNNFVNPLYLIDIMNKDGRDFFVSYYKSEIDAIVINKSFELDRLNRSIEAEQINLASLKKEREDLTK